MAARDRFVSQHEEAFESNVTDVSLQNDIDLAKEVNFTEHLMTFGQLEEKFQTSLDNGLTAKEADFRYQRDGPNAFTPPKQTPNWLILLKNSDL